MRSTVIAVGHAKRGPALDLFEEYARRLSPAPDLIEVEERRPLPAATLRDREAELLLAAVPKDAQIVLLDEAGDQLSSIEFAALLSRWRDAGFSHVAFLIGGASGHGIAVRDRADHILSFGKMTWPHLLVRGLLAEQLYRAQCLTAGHPYHRA